MEEQNAPSSDLPITKKTKLEKKKPKWLKVLEKQSWQAELVISGLAIFGSMQLPGAIHELIDFAAVQLPASTILIAQFFFIYLLIAANVLIINFLIHFILRTIWIGMLGLVSVYPEGINTAYQNFSQDYLQKLKKEFPDIHSFNNNLDHLSSIIFALTALAVMIFVTAGLLVVFIGALAAGLAYCIPSWDFNVIFFCFLMSVSFFSLVQLFLNHKKIREKDWVKKIHFPIFKIFSKIFMLMFYRPANYINLTLLTNNTLKSYYVSFGLYLLVLMMTVGPTVRSSNLGLLNDSVFVNFVNNSMRVQSECYENQLSAGKKIFFPMIQSDIIEGAVIKLFIPRFEREQVVLDSLDIPWTEAENLSEAENRAARWQNRIQVHNQYYQVFLNDSLMQDLKFFNHTHSNQGENGFLTYVPTKHCREGENILKIKFRYWNTEGRQKITHIPFYFFGK